MRLAVLCQGERSMEPILTDAAAPAADDLRPRRRGRVAGTLEVAGPGGSPGDQRRRARRAGPGRRAAGPAGFPGRRLLDGADRPADRLDPPGLRGPLGAGAGRPALAPAGRDHDRRWGELEQSAAKETTNIVGCAYVNALAAHLPARAAIAADDQAGASPAATSWSPRRRRLCTSLPAACSSSPSWSKPWSSTRCS